MNCTHNHDKLVLHFYGELSAAEHEAVQQQLAQCDACQEAWNALQADMQTIGDHVARPQPQAADLHRVREAVRRETAQESALETTPETTPETAPEIKYVGGQTTSQGRMRRMQAVRWVASVAAAFLVFAVGWYLGAVDNEAKWADAVLFDADRQQVRIDYVGEAKTSLSGSIHDAPMQRELGYVLASNIDPVNRMRAARALANARIAPNVDVTTVLTEVLASDENPVVRLQAIRALLKLHEGRPIPEALRKVLIHLLKTEANTAVRMKAMELLVASEELTMDMTTVMNQVASNDEENPYVRFMAHRVLNDSGSYDTQDSGALERLPGKR